MNKIVLNLIALLTINQLIMTSDQYNQFGQNGLIQYIIEQENIIFEQNLNIDSIFMQAFNPTNSRLSYQYKKINNECIPCDSRGVCLSRSAICTDEMIQNLCQAEKNLEDTIIKTIESIKLMNKDGVNFNEPDHFGKTALDYCATKIIYDTLREHGSYFSITKCAYFYPEHVCYATFFTIVTIACITNMYVNSYDLNTSSHHLNHNEKQNLGTGTSLYENQVYKTMKDCLNNCNKSLDRRF